MTGPRDVVLCAPDCVSRCSAQWCALADDLDDELLAAVDLEHLRVLLLGPRTTTVRPDGRYL